ncbi:hypothetical protein PC129_g1630 [Phytophthora cactorum]|uniref:Uncharacterized protein n=1 Tax=Phytophthora cactorum TaxID=29920 RepID=A0A329SWI5_9STRA|nr:hypothetical protein Pcac1_g7710 [Phytophthora cactorum]KAG2842990.1 hypothetical protein PC112_g2826 [Phytophthora cactorum]KAG2843870.1 hypothetical protein PC111_g2202 [Phytophthora cactorum]KAG2866029.1 hypothetical protein PC113_g3200 [Phytophthora cactorum]KAG2928451.1 hypothetical protein PC114_g3144 [Phytophthora cactorum]
MAAEVTERLAACADAIAVVAELRSILFDLAGTQARQAALDEAVVFLTASEERWTLATETLISDLSGNLSERDVQLELLDALLVWATREPAEKNQTVLEILLQFFELALTSLGDNEGGKRWLKWGDQVLAVVHQNAALIEKQESLGSGEEIGEESEGWRSYVVNIAVLLLQLRNKLEGDDDATPDLKTVTFVWKNLAKLATAFGPILASSGPVSGDSGETAGGKDTKKFNVDELVAAAVASVERNVGQLLCVLHGDATGTPDLSVLKFLKLYWRAFQRLITAFADILECELENCVLAIVNVTASLLYAARHSLVLVTSKPGQELRGMLDQALEITEKLADEAVNDQAKESIRTLLWYPAADMVRAVGQRQPSEITNVDVENSIQWGHLLVLTAFAGLSGCSSSNAEVPYDDSVRAVEVSQLFARYRECALSDAVSRSVEATKLFTDLVLEFLIGFESTVELQLALLKQTLYPDWTQRTLCWEIWRELLCFSWDETLAMQTLQLLIDVTQWDDVDSDKSFVLARGMEDEILQLIAFVYADLPLSLKDVCMDQVTAIIDVISSEGPGHQFNLRVASQLHLLEKLVAVQFLKEYNGPMKDEWIAKYLPMCFECCGTVLELLSAEAKAPTIKRENILGMMRVLDMCLMVLRGVFDDNEPKQDDIAELSIILVRMSTEALSQLATHIKQARCSQYGLQSGRKRTSRSVKLEKAGSRCIGRAIETSLYLLSKLGPVLKANRNNQCVQVMKDLLTILDDTKNSSQAGAMNDTLIVTARFVGDSLFDMQVASDDIPVVWQLLLFLFQKLFAATRAADRQAPQLSLLLSVCLDALYELLAHSNIVELPGAYVSTLLAGELKQSFVQSVSMRKLSPEEVAKTLETAQPSTLQSLKRSQSSRYRVFRGQFPDESAELYAEPDQSSQDTSNKRSADDLPGTLPQKRHKLTHFVSLCREIESSLSSIESDEAAVNILSGKDLEDATAVLHKLLTNIITLC